MKQGLKFWKECINEISRGFEGSKGLLENHTRTANSGDMQPSRLDRKGNRNDCSKIPQREIKVSFFLTDREAKAVVDKMENESKEHPKGEKWNKETVLKVFADAGHPTSNARYSENGVYWAMNMVYSDFFPMYKDDVSKYVEHAYLFLNDKDYSGKYAKEKWYAKKRA